MSVCQNRFVPFSVELGFTVNKNDETMVISNLANDYYLITNGENNG